MDKQGKALYLIYLHTTCLNRISLEAEIMNDRETEVKKGLLFDICLNISRVILFIGCIEDWFILCCTLSLRIYV